MQWANIDRDIERMRSQGEERVVLCLQSRKVDLYGLIWQAKNRPGRKRKRDSEDAGGDEQPVVCNSGTVPFVTESIIQKAMRCQANVYPEVTYDGYVVAYISGCLLEFSQPNTGRAQRAGIGVWFGENHPLNVSMRAPDGRRQSKNRAEILAVLFAAKIAYASGVKYLELRFTGSQVMINSLDGFVCQLKANGWKTPSGRLITNRPELEEVDVMSQKMTIRYVLAKGPLDRRGNEEAHRLANEGAKK
jgi:ribonuclease HI